MRGRLKSRSLPREISALRAVAGDDAVAVTPPLGAEDVSELHCAVDGEHYRFAAGSFFQVNRAMLPPLVAEALRFADPAEGNARPVAIDLYCGVGLFTVPLAPEGRTPLSKLRKMVPIL